MFRRTLLTYFT